MLAEGEAAEVRSHIPHGARLIQRHPFLGRGIPQRLGALELVIDAMESLAILLDQGRRVELGVDEHGVDRRVAQERLDDMRRG